MGQRVAGIVFIVLLIAGASGGIWYWNHREQTAGELTLYGNVDLRQADLAFNNNERIARVLVQEGDRVHPGQLLAELETARLKPQVDEAAANVAAQRQALDRLEHGNRPEEIAQARATLASAQADAANSRTQYDRLLTTSQTAVGAVSKQDLDNAKAALDVANAKLMVAQKALDLEVAGPRVEDIAQARAQLAANEAHAAMLKQQLIDAQLLAPSEGVIRSRLMEPGEMASPQKPVFSLAITSPKWVRAYVSEPDLGKIHPGDKMRITVDSFPNRGYEGFIGFISPVAEFTPKSVQTEELRTSLVYEVRVFVVDPNDDLRLGMPATVRLRHDVSTSATRPTTSQE